MKRFAILLALALAAAACNESTPAVTDSTEARMAIAIEYARGDGAEVHAKPSADSPVVAKYSPGESVSVLAKNGEWAEVRTADGSGWTRTSALAPSVEAKQVEADNSTPRFRKAPAPVTQPGVHGEIVVEANVNIDGDVTSTKTTLNTTGSEGLAFKNAAAIQNAKFYPIVQKGRRREFIYEYRVHY